MTAPFSPFDPPLARDFVKQSESVSSWLVRGLIKDQGFTLLSGPPKLAGKSLYSDVIALSVACGKTVGNDEVVAQANVLSVQEETPLADAQDRLLAVAASHGLDEGLDHLYYSHLAGTDLLASSHRLEICRLVKERNIRLVILDPWSNVFPDDENDKKLVTIALHFIRAIQSAGAAVMLIMHWNKEGMKERKMDMDLCLRGHTALQGAYDTHRALRRYSEDEAETYVQTRNKHAKRADPQWFRWDLEWVWDSLRGEEKLVGAKLIWR